ncbi:MAG TPA: hypothetical protein P5270_04935 [Victivallales bacterium]|nr:hypothetical protein [Victivallales bacterium]
MIQISAQDFFILYIVFCLLSILLLWIRELIRLKSYQWYISSPSICICSKCHRGFLVKAGEKLANCPRCNDICVIKRK